MDISRKKTSFPIPSELFAYLKYYQRLSALPLAYEDLLEYHTGIPVLDKKGRDTLWQTVIYPPHLDDEIRRSLVEIYALLKTDGDRSFIGHLRISHIDHCLFGNSNPFRVRVVNMVNDNHDYYYIKRADASRICGLELEHILSPNRMNYLVHGHTLIEEHIAGIPGDVFLQFHMDRPGFSRIRMAKEFVKFNQRCFAMLLGDMRAYNYVIDVTPDFDMEQYRVRAIDFDQLSYEGRKNHYLPQFYKENFKVVQFCMENLTPETVNQYETEERTLIKKRYELAKNRLDKMLDVMGLYPFSTQEKIDSLCHDLNIYHQTQAFHGFDSMGKVLRLHLKYITERTEHRKYFGKTAYKREA